MLQLSPPSLHLKRRNVLDPATLPPPSEEGELRGGEVAMPRFTTPVLVYQLPLSLVLI